MPLLPLSVPVVVITVCSDPKNMNTLLRGVSGGLDILRDLAL